MILEAILTTENSDGTMHVAPMGPHVTEDLSEWTLLPFQSSTTFRNLYASKVCVAHIVDDALLLATAVLGQANQEPARQLLGGGYILNESCHWYSLHVTTWDLSNPRAIAKCEVQSSGFHRPFFGWNRAKHAVVELAILTSRVGLLEPQFVVSEIARLQILIDKTAGDRERTAFQLLKDFIVDRPNESAYESN